MIKMENVWFSYDGRKYALKGINAEFHEGNYYAILGDNGSGKTTLLKHLNGLLKPNKGRVLVDGLDTKKIPVSILSKKIALSFQNPEAMFFSSTVYDEIAFALRNFGYKKEVIDRLVGKVLSIFDLDRYSNYSPFNLSEGEKRRLAIACVYAWEPKYLVLDEPTAGQDQIQRELLVYVIKHVVRQGRTVIIASHDVEFIAETKPYIYLLKEGEILREGPAEEVLLDEKVLEKAGLIVPYIAQVFRSLDSKRYHKIPINPDEASDLILNFIKRGDNFDDS